MGKIIKKMWGQKNKTESLWAAGLAKGILLFNLLCMANVHLLYIVQSGTVPCLIFSQFFTLLLVTPTPGTVFISEKETKRPIALLKTASISRHYC